MYRLTPVSVVIFVVLVTVSPGCIEWDLPIVDDAATDGDADADTDVDGDADADADGDGDGDAYGDGDSDVDADQDSDDIDVVDGDLDGTIDADRDSDGDVDDPCTFITGITCGEGENRVVNMAAGQNHTCALLQNGELWCWGDNDNGQLTGRLREDRSDPFPSAPELCWTDIASDGAHTCARQATGEAMCWGINGAGQIGDPEVLGSTSIPTSARGMTCVAGVTTGRGHTCAWDIEGRAWCWGSNQHGQVGDGIFGINRDVPTAVEGMEGLYIVGMTAGLGHTCAWTRDFDAYCWGRNNHGQVGNGLSSDAVPVSTPTRVAGRLEGLDILGMTAGEYHTCAWTRSGQLYCWGRNSADFHELGGVEEMNVATPHEMLSVLTGVGGAVSQGRHTCAWTTEGLGMCWGSNGSGQCGTGEISTHVLPDSDEAVGVRGLIDGMVVGAEHTCAWMRSGGVECWGSNEDGQLGNSAIPASGSSRPASVNDAWVDDTI